MVEEALVAGSIRSQIQGVYVAGMVEKYKPAPEIYWGLLLSLGKEALPRDVWLVSG